MPKSERRTKRKELREVSQTQRERHFDFNKLDFGKIISREAVWTLTGTGPFRAHLKKINKADASRCRFCGSADETSEHLTTSCDRIKTRLGADCDAATLEKTITEIFKELMRRSH